MKVVVGNKGGKLLLLDAPDGGILAPFGQHSLVGLADIAGLGSLLKHGIVVAQRDQTHTGSAESY